MEETLRRLIRGPDPEMLAAVLADGDERAAAEMREAIEERRGNGADRRGEETEWIVEVNGHRRRQTYCTALASPKARNPCQTRIRTSNSRPGSASRSTSVPRRSSS
ncbi:MAG: hypothetical protein V5A29_19475, partial [Haloarculaceae archaeon]